MLDEQAIAVVTPVGESTLFQVDLKARQEVTFDDLVAAVSEYAPDEVTPELFPEIIATQLTLYGWDGLHQRAEEIAAAEKAGTAGEWLPRYRQLVREFTGQGVAVEAVAA